jgi:hypothetical protein
LRADRHQPGAESGQVRQQFFLVGPQGQVAVGAPAAPVEHNDGRAGRHELVQGHHRPGGIAQREGIEGGTDFDGAGRDALVKQVLDAPVEHGDDLLRQTRRGDGLYLLGLLVNGDGHRSSRVVV